MSDFSQTQKEMKINDQVYKYFSLKDAETKLGDVSRLPFSLKVLLENLLRHVDNTTVTEDDLKTLAHATEKKPNNHEIAFRPARVLMQDFTGVPAVVDLAAMRDAMKNMNKDPQKINPLIPVDLVIDHSVTIDFAGDKSALDKNTELEFERNGERYKFLKWGQKAFNNFRVVPPGTGICHQVNIEYLAKVIWDNKNTLYPDTVVGTDSHTTMVNALGVLGWGVGGIEAEAAMLGQPVSMLIPDVIGFKMTGRLKEGVTATDLVLTVVEMLRKKGVVGKFVEFYGEGLDHLPLADRATIANMAPEYGATCGFFPVDAETIRYLRFTGRDKQHTDVVEQYAKEQGLWRDSNTEDPIYTDTLHLDLGDVMPCLAGPRRPQDRILLKDAKSNFNTFLKDFTATPRSNTVSGKDFSVTDGDVVIAAITSCTNTSNPNVLIAAGLVARKALAKGLKAKPWVKTSLAPGSQVVTDYLATSKLQDDLDNLGFNIVGYGCTTCIGNSGPLDPDISKAIEDEKLVVNAVLSGNRNFEGRIHPLTRGNYLASPPLVVAYAIAGTMNIDLYNDPIGEDKSGNPVYLKDIWPSNEEVHQVVEQSLTPEMFQKRYQDVFKGTDLWQKIETSEGQTYDWDKNSTYVQHPPFFEGLSAYVDSIKDVSDAKLLAVLGDSVTTDHISPAGAFAKTSPAGQYLTERNIEPKNFNSYGSRRGNHEIMMRGTLANIRIKNEIAPGTEGGYSSYNGEIMPMYDAAMKYATDNTPLVIVGGKEYGTGSSRDWAAKGVLLLSVKVVITESFERIHRSNLVGMGVLPLQFKEGQTRKDLALTGKETFTFHNLQDVSPCCDVPCTITYEDGKTKDITLTCRIDTGNEIEYYKNGGILQYVLRQIAQK